MSQISPSPGYSIVRIVGIVIIALMLGSILYSLWIALLNWSQIMV